MAQYVLEEEFNNLNYGREEVNFQEFERCTFNHCDFSQCVFLDVTFIDCTFNRCNFTGAKINHVAFRTVFFNGCNATDVNFAMCDKLIFEIHFDNCILDFAKFYTLKIKGTTFTNCKMVAVDFMKTDLTNVVFDHCDLHKTLFTDSVLHKADFSSAFNYTFDPQKNKIKNAIFSRDGVKGLLAKHDIIVV